MTTVKTLKVVNLDGSNSDIAPIIVDDYFTERLQRLILSYIGLKEIYITLIYNNNILHDNNNIFKSIFTIEK